MPMVDVDTIGAGGGSIAYVDAGGIFRVGPRSAGADPGPAATVAAGPSRPSTDAHGHPRLASPRGGFLGGQMELAADLARRGDRRAVADALGMSDRGGGDGRAPDPERTRWSSRSRTTRCAKGYDPRDFALVAEGGAGPLFAAAIALELGIARGARAALPGGRRRDRPARDGLQSRVRRDRLPARCRSLDADGARGALRRARAAQATRASSTQDGVAEDRTAFTRRLADCRYAGQGYELRVDVPAGPDRRGLGREHGASDFHDAHEREYCHRFEGSDVEILNIRVVADRPDADELVRRRLERGDGDAAAALRHERDAWSSTSTGAGAAADAVLRARGSSAPATASTGPAIIEQYDSTTVIPPALSSRDRSHGNIVIETVRRDEPGAPELRMSVSLRGRRSPDRLPQRVESTRYAA